MMHVCDCLQTLRSPFASCKSHVLSNPHVIMANMRYISTIISINDKNCSLSIALIAMDQKLQKS